MKLAALLVLIAACGSDEGEPMAGDVAITYGDEVIAPTVGAVITDVATGDDDPTKALVLIGTRAVACDTTLTTVLPKGTYVSFAIDRSAGVQAPEVGVIRIDSNAARLNSASGTVTIDALADRVTGSITVSMQDADVGPIAVAGTFDVIRCF